MLRPLNIDKDYRFGFNGQHKENEVAGIGNHNSALFWEYDTRLGRRWNIDPVDQIGISNYATFANNPIANTDVLGNVVEGVAKKDATRTKQTMNETFSGDENSKLRDMFKIGKDGKTFEKISDKVYEDATKDVKNKDILSLAKGYKDKINDDKNIYHVEALYDGEENSQFSKDNNFAGYNGKALKDDGGGVSGHTNKPNEFLIMFSMENNTVGNEYFSPVLGKNVIVSPTRGEVLAHELIGHNGGRTGTDERSIQVSNIYLRAKGAGYERTGSQHGNEFKIKFNRNGIPSDLRNDIKDYIGIQRR